MNECSASMEEIIDGKKKNEPSIPANYVSILLLQERWLKEKERKQKEKKKGEEAQQQRKQQLDEQKRREKDLENLEADKQLKEVGGNVPSRKSDGKGFGRKNWMHSGRSHRGKAPIGGEAIPGEAEEPVAAAIVSENGEAAAAAAAGDERLLEIKRKKKKGGKKKKNQAPIKEDVSGREPNAPPENSRTENILVKKEIWRVSKLKIGSATGGRDSPPRKSAPMDSTSTKTRFEALSINGCEERGDATHLKPRARLNHGRDNERRYGMAVRRGEPMRAAMVWVKKGEIQGNGVGNGQ